jgi:hypothetical protein
MATGKSFAYRTDVVEQLMDDGEVGTTTKITWLGDSKRNVGDIVNQEQNGTRQGALAMAIKAFLDAQPGAVSTKDIMDAFNDQRQGTVQMNLKRLSQRGLIHSPVHGHWQSMKYAPADQK